MCNDKAGSPGAIIEVLGVWSVEADAKASVDYFLAQNGSSFTQRIRGALFTVELGVGKFVSPGDPRESSRRSRAVVAPSVVAPRPKTPSKAESANRESPRRPLAQSSCASRTRTSTS